MVDKVYKNAMREVLKNLLDLGEAYLRGEPPCDNLPFPDPNLREIFNMHKVEEKIQYLKVRRMRVLSARLSTRDYQLREPRLFKETRWRHSDYSMQLHKEKVSDEEWANIGYLTKTRTFDLKGLVKAELARRSLDCTEFTGSSSEYPLLGVGKSTSKAPVFCKNIKGRLNHIFRFAFERSANLKLHFEYDIWLSRVTGENDYWFSEGILSCFLNEKFEYPVETKEDAAKLIKDAIDVFERIQKPVEDAVLVPLEKYGIV